MLYLKRTSTPEGDLEAEMQGARSGGETVTICDLPAPSTC